jgi:D-arabinose 1-dehydrogenase-like Zn-dependent alcohol dehydrogenase
MLIIAVQYARARGASVIAVDSGKDKREYLLSVGAKEFVDFALVPDVIQEVHKITNGGASAVVVAAGNPKAFAHAAEMLRVGGTLSCIGIPPGRPFIETPISTIVIKGLKITGNLIGSLKECMEAVELTRRGIVMPKVQVRPFRELTAVYEQLERGDIPGRIVLQIAQDA